MKYWCSYQEKLAIELRQGRPPEHWDEPLRNHVANCPSCNDLVLVTQSLQQDRTETVKSARVASPGMLWWQAQVRMRNGAMERINRPVALAEKFAWIILTVAFVASIAWKGGQILGWFIGSETAAHSSMQGGESEPVQRMDDIIHGRRPGHRRNLRRNRRLPAARKRIGKPGKSGFSLNAVHLS